MEKSLVVITNTSSGIGQELARQFSGEYFELLICSANDEIFSIQNELEQEGYIVEAMQVNLTTYNGVENLYHRVKNYGKKLDSIIINNDSYSVGNFLNDDLKTKIKTINSNILSTIHLMQRALMDMTEREEGNILISLSSSPNAIDSASLAFIHSLMDSVRKEIKGRGVRLSLLHLDSEQENDLKETARYAIEAMLSGKGNAYPDSIMAKIHNYATRILPEKPWSNISRH